MYFVIDEGWGSVLVVREESKAKVVNKYDEDVLIVDGPLKTRRQALVRACEYLMSLLREDVSIDDFPMGIEDKTFKR
jgi:hypothetical protein